MLLLQLSTVVEVFRLPDQCWEQKTTKGKPPLGLYNNAATAIGGLSVHLDYCIYKGASEYKTTSLQGTCNVPVY